ncbi:radical SAM protein [Candidatus Pelagibacter sp.]|nr:radical SAM protein [Candidatus Pelagibacter sp.]
MKFNTILSIIYINIKLIFLKIFNKKVVPYKILINLTDLCNSRCAYCDIWKIKPKNEIDLINIKNSLSGIEKDIYWMSFSGGEVTLVSYFYELIDYLKDNLPNLKLIAFTTNALSVSKAEKYANYIKEKGFDSLITISLDGDEYHHDKIRGIKGNYQKCLKLYNILKSKKIPCHFGITVSDQNLNFIKKSYRNFVDTIKAVTFVHSDGIYNKKNSYNHDKEILEGLEYIVKNYRIKKLSEIIEWIHIKISIKFLKKKREENIIACDVLNSSIHINPNGDLKPCMFMPNVGNIKSNSIKDIILNQKTQSAKELIKKNHCPKCWMNCYSPHSIMQNPFKSLWKAFF